MKNQKKIRLYLFLFLCIAAIQPTEAQLLKKLKKKLEDKTIKKAEEKVDGVFNGKDSKPDAKKKEEKTAIKTQKQPEKTSSSSPKQKLDKNNTVVLDDSDLLIFKSPSSAFKDIIVQKINNLPRAGKQNMYMKNHHSPDISKEIGDKRLKMNSHAFDKLIKIHFMKDYFKAIDKTALTPIVKNPSKEDAMSNIAQGLLLDFVVYMATEETRVKYFNSTPRSDGKEVRVHIWGGLKGDSFTQNESYVTFVNDHLNTILKWSDTFFETTNENLYNVNSLKIDQYDFDANGYWIKIPKVERSGVITDNYFYEHLPQTKYGRNLKDIGLSKGKILLKINAEIAEKKLSDNFSKTIFFILKTKMVFKEISTNTSPYFDTPAYTYHFTSPIIEVYTNQGLKEKIGEIDLENLTYEKP